VSTTTTQTFDPVVAINLVAQTQPAIGQSVKKGHTIVLAISKGPAQLPLPDIVGQQTATAKDLIRKAHFTVGSPTIEQFDPKIARGVVIAGLDENGKNIAALSPPTYSERHKITLIVSAGTLPVVAGQKPDDAIRFLQQNGLGAAPGADVYSDTVAEGLVVGIDPETNKAGVARIFRKGDTNVKLLISRGPEPVAVPDVIGEPWSVAKPKLVALGFDLDYNHNADGNVFAIVSSVKPGSGSQVTKGTTLKIKFLGG
jgi:beta-lactam-binding protein with PASTA domain